MRSYPTAALIGLSACSCAAESVSRPPPPPVDWQSLQIQSAPDAGNLRATEKERAVAELYAKAFASPGFAQLGSMLAEDAHFNFGDTDTRGRERVVKAHDKLFGSFEERVLHLNRLFRTDRSQALEWFMSGVGPARRPVKIKGSTLLWTNDDGSISDIHVYFDQRVAKAQLGVGSQELQRLPPPPVPAGPPQVFEQEGTPEEAASIALMRAMLQALEDNKESAYLSTMANDVEIFTLDRTQPVRGKDAVERLFRTLRRTIADLDTVVHNAWGVQQFAVVEYSIAGLQLAPLGRIPFVPNRLFSTRLVDVAEVRNGKITRIWRNDDSGALEPSK
jgi:ketosteroid isomerase-like protein